MNFLSSLPMRSKLLLMVALPVLGMLGFSALTTYGEYKDLQEAQNVQRLFHATRHLDSLIESIAAERGRTFAFSSTSQVRLSSQLNRQYARSDVVIQALRDSMQAADWMQEALPEIWSDYLMLEQDLALLVKRRRSRIDDRRKLQYRSIAELADYTKVILEAQELKRSVRTLTKDSKLVVLEQPYSEVQEVISAMGIQRALGAWILAHGEVSGSIGINLLHTRQRIALGMERLEANPVYSQHRNAMKIEFAIVNEQLLTQVVAEVEAYLGRLNRFRNLQSSIGYGGLIHQFKNYVIRGEERYRLSFIALYEEVEKELADAMADEDLAAATHNQLKLISETLHAYREGLDIVQSLHRASASVEEIDASVKVSDRLALAAIEAIFSYRPANSAEDWFRVQTQRIARMTDLGGRIRGQMQEHLSGRVMHQRQIMLRNVFLTMMILACSLLVLLVVYRDTLRGLHSAVRSLNEIAQHGRITEVEKLDREDELGELSRATGNLVHSTHAIIEQAERVGNGDYTVIVEPRSDQDQLVIALRKMIGDLISLRDKQESQRYLQERLVALSAILRNGTSLHETAGEVLQYVVRESGALGGVFYLPVEGGGGFAASHLVGVERHLVPDANSDEGYVGEVLKAREMFLRERLPVNYLAMQTGLGRAEPTNLLILPLWERDVCVGGIELGSCEVFDASFCEFLRQSQEPLALGLLALLRRQQLEEYVTELNERRATLEAREHDLKALNAELQAQAESLQASEEELRVSNEELELSTTSLRESHQTLQKQAEELEQASTYKTEFLANMSHELRTPLNSILIVSQSFAQNREGNLTPDQVHSAQMVESSGRSLLQLINDILDMSKVEAGMLDVMADSVALRSFSNDLQNLFSPLAQEHGIELIVDFADDVPENWTTDPQRCAQILKNFLSNAVKFTKEGSVTLRVAYEQDGRLDHYEDQRQGGGQQGDEQLADKQSGLIRFDVIDTGVGIEKSAISRIFEHFQQEDGSTSRDFGGSGLGLTISLRLAALLGGIITADSEKGKGSTFTLLIPQMLVSAQADEEEKDSSEQAPGNVDRSDSSSQSAPVVASWDGSIDPEVASILKERKILIADDDLRNCFSLSSELRRYGAYVLLAKDGEQCMQKLHEHGPVDVVIVDLMMPVMDGFETTQAIRAERALAGLPIVVLTARSFPTDETKAREYGANEFLRKPVEVNELAATLAGLIEDNAA